MLNITLKIITSIILVLFGVYVAGHARSPFFLLFGIMLMLSPAGLIGSELVKIFEHLFSFFLFPNRKEQLPGYSMAEALRLKGKYNEALEKLEELSLDYPEEMEIYRRMFEIAACDLNDRRELEMIYITGNRKIRKKSSFVALRKCYQEYKAMLVTKTPLKRTEP